MLLIGTRLAIMGSGDTSPVPGGRVAVTLTPSPHTKVGNPYAPWTRSMLEAIENLVQPGMTVIDFGSGNGILALAAAKLGATTVHAIERADLPSRIARVNITANGLAGVITFTEDDFTRTTLPAAADLVIADFDAKETVKEAGNLSRTRLSTGQHFLTMPETRHVTEVDNALIDLTLVEQVAVGDRWTRLDFTR